MTTTTTIPLPSPSPIDPTQTTQLLHWLRTTLHDPRATFEVTPTTLSILTNLQHYHQLLTKASEYLEDDDEARHDEYRALNESLRYILCGLKRIIVDEGVVCYCEDVGSVGNVLGVGYEYLGSKEVILGSVCEVVVRVLQGGGFEGDGRRGFEEEVRKGVLRVSGVERCERVFLERVGDEGGVLKEGLEERARVLEIKEEEYRKSARGLKEIVRGTGITKDRTHGCLVMEMEKVEGLKKELGDLEDMLKAFEDLPPDLSLARVKVEQTRQESARLDQRISASISAI